MITERRISLTGGWITKERNPQPQDMTDKELKKKVCANRHGDCAACILLDGCKYGKEYVRRFEKEGNG